MQRLIRFNQQADHFARLAEESDWRLSETFRSMEAAYRVMAMSVRTELWWPRLSDRGGERR